MLIAFEGGEGSGKGTHIRLLRQDLVRLGHNVLCIVEPGGTDAGQAIRDILLNRTDLDLSGLTEAFLFSASRAQQVLTVTRPALNSGLVVLSDRSFYSTYAYQGYGRKQNLQLLQKLTDIAVGNTQPDVVILLDLPPELGLERKQHQNEINRLDVEGMDFHNRVRAGYLEMSKKDTGLWKVVDATRALEDVYSSILAMVLSALERRDN